VVFAGLLLFAAISAVIMCNELLKCSASPNVAGKPIFQWQFNKVFVEFYAGSPIHKDKAIQCKLVSYIIPLHYTSWKQKWTIKKILLSRTDSYTILLPVSGLPK
jgi:hypothetical protein